VLNKIELFVAGGGPEVFPDDDLVFFLGIALLVHEMDP
jgi:hypothetical protein